VLARIVRLSRSEREREIERAKEIERKRVERERERLIDELLNYFYYHEGAANL
jgi:hypothetical protein